MRVDTVRDLVAGPLELRARVRRSRPTGSARRRSTPTLAKARMSAPRCRSRPERREKALLRRDETSVRGASCLGGSREEREVIQVPFRGKLRLPAAIPNRKRRHSTTASRTAHPGKPGWRRSPPVTQPCHIAARCSESCLKSHRSRVARTPTSSPTDDVAGSSGSLFRAMNWRSNWEESTPPAKACQEGRPTASERHLQGAAAHGEWAIFRVGPGELPVIDTPACERDANPRCVGIANRGWDHTNVEREGRGGCPAPAFSFALKLSAGVPS